MTTVKVIPNDPTVACTQAVGPRLSAGMAGRRYRKGISPIDLMRTGPDEIGPAVLFTSASRLLFLSQK